MIEKLKNAILFEHQQGYFYLDNLSNWLSEVDIEHYQDVVHILNDLIKNHKIEFYDFKMLCKEIYNWNHKVFANFTHYFFNQHIIRQDIFKLFDIKE